MDDKIRRNLEMGMRVRDFGAMHPALFPAGSRGAELLAALGPLLDQLDTLAAAQASGVTNTREATKAKANARTKLKKSLKAIQLTAAGLSVKTPGVADKFRLPNKITDQSLLASGRAFAKDALPRKAEFITLEMPASFITDLDAVITHFETTLTDARTAKDARVAATADMQSLMAQVLENIEELRAYMRNKLRDDDGLLTAWLAASRVEKPRKGPSKSKKPPTKDTKAKPGDASPKSSTVS
jgi:hypothetical protein